MSGCPTHAPHLFPAGTRSPLGLRHSPALPALPARPPLSPTLPFQLTGRKPRHDSPIDSGTCAVLSFRGVQHLQAWRRAMCLHWRCSAHRYPQCPQTHWGHHEQQLRLLLAATDPVGRIPPLCPSAPLLQGTPSHFQSLLSHSAPTIYPAYTSLPCPPHCPGPREAMCRATSLQAPWVLSAGCGCPYHQPLASHSRPLLAMHGLSLNPAFTADGLGMSHFNGRDMPPHSCHSPPQSPAMRWEGIKHTPLVSLGRQEGSCS